MTSLCSLLDDWENCAAPHPVPRSVPLQAARVARDSDVIQRRQDTALPKPEPATATGEKAECCDALRHEFNELRKRIDTDRHFILALTSALLILFVMQITAQVRIDHMFSRKA